MTNLGQLIAPIPYTGANKLFGVNMMEAEIKEITDKNGDIRYNINFEWMLTTFGGGKSFWDFLVAWMQSHMTHLMNQGWKP